MRAIVESPFSLPHKDTQLSGRYSDQERLLIPNFLQFEQLCEQFDLLYQRAQDPGSGLRRTTHFYNNPYIEGRSVWRGETRVARSENNTKATPMISNTEYAERRLVFEGINNGNSVLLGVEKAIYFEDTKLENLTLADAMRNGASIQIRYAVVVDGELITFTNDGPGQFLKVDKQKKIREALGL